MPGVTVTTAVKTGPVNALGPIAGQLLVAGVAQRGPVGAPVSIRSIADYEQHFGPRTAYSGVLHDTVATFFEEGGYLAQVTRVVGPAATSGSLSVNDSAAVATVKFTATSAGAWADDVKIEIAAGSQADTFKVVVTYLGDPVQAVDNLASPAAALAAFGTSPWVTVTDLGSSTAAPGNNPAVAAATALTGGDDDRANITNSQATGALAAFGDELGPGAVALPEWDAATVGAAVIAHCKTNGRIGLLSGGIADDQATVQAAAAGLTTDGDYAGLFYPWVTIPDASGDRSIPPEGYVAAARARAHADVGFWQVPAGDPATVRHVTGTTVRVDKATNNELATHRVSGIATIGGTVKLYGWFSLSTDDAFTLLTARDSLNSVTRQATVTLEPFVWRTVDGRGLLQSEIDSAIRGLLQPITDAGGFFPRTDDDGDQLDPGYSVQVNGVNDLTNLADNEIIVAVSIRLSPSAKEITVTITKAALTAAL